MGFIKFAKQLVGVQAYQDRKEAQSIKINAEKNYYNAKSDYDRVGEQK